MIRNCRHTDRVPVDVLADGRVETVAQLCLDCTAQLHPGFGCEHCEWEEIYTHPVLRLRWWAVLRWLRRCPECHQRPYSGDAPRWDADPVAQMLGIAHTGCPCCGKEAAS